MSTLFAALMVAGYTEADAIKLFLAQLEQRGISAPRDLQTLFTQNSLAQLEANMLEILPLIATEKRTQVLAALAQTFGDEHPGIVHNALSEVQLTEYVTQLAKRVPRQVPLNDTGLVTFYEEGVLSVISPTVIIQSRMPSMVVMLYRASQPSRCANSMRRVTH